VEIAGSVCVVTGGARGIGASMATRFARAGALAVVVCDLDAAAAGRTADRIGPTARGVACDVTDEQAVRSLVADVLDREGPIDLFCANAGIAGGGDVDTDDGVWQTMWNVHVMAHVYSARAVLPAMIERGRGHLLHTASAAGLLMSPGDAPYSVTKHAAVAFAEWLSVTYGGRGITVSCLCPQGVRTDLLMDLDGPAADWLRSEMIEPDRVADAVIEGLRDGRFLILPHPEVARYAVRRATDPERWLRSMRSLVASMAPGDPPSP
jgi:NAD(P)-dependent dehydrogenase (short-subunit alcohol dehydrogenase family)